MVMEVQGSALARCQMAANKSVLGQINPITITSKTVNSMRPTPCVYENR